MDTKNVGHRFDKDFSQLKGDKRISCGIIVDYGGFQLDKKSTTVVVNFLGQRLNSHGIEFYYCVSMSDVRNKILNSPLQTHCVDSEIFASLCDFNYNLQAFFVSVMYRSVQIVIAAKTVWIPTGKIFASYTSKADSKPTHGSNVYISNIHECKLTLDLSADTSINVQKEQSFDLSIEVPTSDMIVMMSMIELESLFGPLFDEYFNEENQVVTKSSAVTTADASDKRQQQPDSTSSTSTPGPIVTADGNFDL
ncbi:hypothetical protein Tco_0965909 [Tanacetum coccineum]